jgi:hypothetical protein
MAVRHLPLAVLFGKETASGALMRIPSGPKQRVRHRLWLATAIITGVLMGVLPRPGRADNSKVQVVTEGPNTTLSGSDAIHPKNGSLPFSSGPGAEGFNNTQFKNTSQPLRGPR